MCSLTSLSSEDIHSTVSKTGLQEKTKLKKKVFNYFYNDRERPINITLITAKLKF